MFCVQACHVHATFKSAAGYRLAYHNTVVSHHCFMGDVKVFAKDALQLGDTLQIVDKMSEAIGTKLGLRKCAVVHIERGKLVEGKDYMLVKEGW